MVYSVTVRGFLSYKQDLSSLESMLEDQKSTYAVLRYCTEIPSQLYSYTMKQLSCEIDSISDRKLNALIKKFIKASGCIIVMDEELESSFYIDPKTGKILTDNDIEEVDGIPHIRDNTESKLVMFDEDED